MAREPNHAPVSARDGTGHPSTPPSTDREGMAGPPMTGPSLRSTRRSTAAVSKIRLALTSLACALVLLIWHGFAQFLPWGVSTTRSYSSTSGETYVFGAPQLQQAAPGTWTTGAFARDLGDGVSTLATDESFAWVVSAPRDYYDPSRYFAIHALTQLGVGVLLSLATWLLREVARRRRIALVFVMGVAGALSTYGGMMNWWGLPVPYGVGEAANLVAGWMIALFAADRLLLGPIEGRLHA